MFVITADQVDSRTTPDIVGRAKERLDAAYRRHLRAPVGRSGGDELQLLLADASATLDVVLELTREGRWSVGVGVGPVRTPLPAAVVEATGPAFYAAREAVTAAKGRPQRFALAVDEHASDDVRTRAADAESLVTHRHVLRERRSDAGWEIRGHGSLLRYLRKIGLTWPYTGFDIVDTMIAAARAESGDDEGRARFHDNLL